MNIWLVSQYELIKLKLRISKQDMIIPDLLIYLLSFIYSKNNMILWRYTILWYLSWEFHELYLKPIDIPYVYISSTIAVLSVYNEKF